MLFFCFFTALVREGGGVLGRLLEGVREKGDYGECGLGGVVVKVQDLGAERLGVEDIRRIDRGGFEGEMGYVG